MWETMETEAGKDKVAEVERDGRKEKRRKSRETEEEVEERKDDRGKGSNGRVGDLG